MPEEFVVSVDEFKPREKLTVEMVSTRIMSAIQDLIKESRMMETSEEIELVRLGLGCSLSGLHTVYLSCSKDPQTQQECAAACMDTIQRLIGSLKRDLDELKIEGVSIVDYKIPVGATDAEVKAIIEKETTDPVVN